MELNAQDREIGKLYQPLGESAMVAVKVLKLKKLGVGYIPTP
jgi:hypothetical protein